MVQGYPPSPSLLLPPTPPLLPPHPPACPTPPDAVPSPCFPSPPWPRVPTLLMLPLCPANLQPPFLPPLTTPPLPPQFLVSMQTPHWCHAYLYGTCTAFKSSMHSSPVGQLLSDTDTDDHADCIRPQYHMFFAQTKTCKMINFCKSRCPCDASNVLALFTSPSETNMLFINVPKAALASFSTTLTKYLASLFMSALISGQSVSKESCVAPQVWTESKMID